MVEVFSNSRIQDLLFREIHHRFYNSLQAISASANLLTRRQASPDTIRTFQGRIAMLGDLHRLLTDPVNHDGCITMTLKRICACLAATFGRDDVSFDIQIREMPARPLSARVILLAVVELVTNAFKHGNPYNPICITILADHVGDNFRLLVASNTLPSTGSQTVRPRIVNEMVEALGGEMAVRCISEFEVEVRLPKFTLLT